MMKQKFLWAILPAFCLLSCSKGDDKTDPEPEPETPVKVSCIIAACPDQDKYMDISYEFSLGDKTVTVKSSDFSDVTSKAATYCPDIKAVIERSIRFLSNPPAPLFLEANLGEVTKGTTIKGVKSVAAPKADRPQTETFLFYYSCTFIVNGKECITTLRSTGFNTVSNTDEGITKACSRKDFASYKYE